MNNAQQPKHEQRVRDQPFVNSVRIMNIFKQSKHKQGERDQRNVNNLEHSKHEQDEYY